MLPKRVMGNGEWGMGNGKWEMGMEDQKLLRLLLMPN